MQGYKTLVTNLLITLAGLLAQFGIVIPTEHIQSAVGGVIALIGIVNIVLRFFTKTPVGKKE